jgi:hypothetical protein
MGEFDWQAYEAELADLAPLVDAVPTSPDESPPVPAEPTGDQRTDVDGPMPVDGTALLDEVRMVLCRYLVLPSPEATDAVALWIVATHGQPVWEHATRLAITGPTRRCGKSRLLDIVKELAHKTIPSVNASTAALYRSIDSTEPPTILYDEADATFGTKRQAEANEDLRALLNAGHSRGWPILRCVGPNQEVKEFPSFAMAAIAGIGDLPDTIADRAVNIRMRRRAPSETVQPFRTVRDTPPLRELRGRVHRWVRAHLADLHEATPTMPVEDRAADTWESLIAIADLAGGDWPKRARTACTTLVNAAADADTDNSDSLRLLADLRTVFGDGGNLHTATILDRLRAIEDSPWTELTARHLSTMLRGYGIKPKSVRETGTGESLRGYHHADLADVFTRYLPPPGHAESGDQEDADDTGDTNPKQDHVVDVVGSQPASTTALTCDVVDVVDVVAPPPPPNQSTEQDPTTSDQPTGPPPENGPPARP